jgi:hypothetical protein
MRDGQADPEQRREQGHGPSAQRPSSGRFGRRAQAFLCGCDGQELFKVGNAKLVHDIDCEHAEQGDASEDIDGLDAFAGIDGSRGTATAPTATASTMEGPLTKSCSTGSRSIELF